MYAYVRVCTCAWYMPKECRPIEAADPVSLKPKPRTTLKPGPQILKPQSYIQNLKPRS